MKQSKFRAIASFIGWKVRQVKKLVFYNKMATPAFWKNQEHIISELEENKNVILNPIPPIGGDGSSDNYFHFIFDLLLPLFLIVRKVPDAKIGLPFVRLGYLKHYLAKLFPNSVYDSSQILNQDRLDMHGMNPLLVELDRHMVTAFKAFVVTALDIKLNQKQNKVVLIERVAPNEDLTNNLNGAKTGSYKRHIKNHEVVKSYLGDHLNEQYDLVNARLEHYSLEEQISLFDQAVLVIAQHGAGLANICWMRPNARVVEIKNGLLRRHYVCLSKYVGIEYDFLFQRGMHIELDINKLDRLLRRSPSTIEILNAE